MQRRGNIVYLSAAADPTKDRHFISNQVRRYSGSKKRPPSGRSYKRFRGTADVLDELVLATAKAMHDEGNAYGFAAEEIAYRVNVRVDQIKHSLHRLNLRGIINQPYRDIPHDTTRERWGGVESGWGANRYTFRKLT